MPPAAAMADRVAATEPFPFVPATSTAGTCRSGRPSRSQRASIAARPSFMPRGRSDSRRAKEGKGTDVFWARPRATAARDTARGFPSSGAVHDVVEHAVLEEKLGSLEPFGQRLPDRLLDHP